MNKAELRRWIRGRKRCMTEELIRGKSDALASLLFETEVYRRAESIYGYVSYNQEVRTLPILAQALRDGKRVAVPKCFADEMCFIWIRDLDGLEKNALGIPEPVADGPVAEDESALVLMPGLAFDRAGHRIGYGGGYYDKFLSRERNHPKVALCYDFQLFDQLETEEFDVPADWVLWA